MWYGVDISSRKIAIAGYNGDGFLFHEINAPSKRDWLHRFYWLYDEFDKYVEETFTSDDIVYIEDIPYVRNIKTLTILVHMVAATRLVLNSHDIPHIFVSNTTWKSKTGIKGGRKNSKEVKKLIKERCIELFDVDERVSQDCMDALLIAYYGYNEENNG